MKNDRKMKDERRTMKDENMTKEERVSKVRKAESLEARWQTAVQGEPHHESAPGA